MATETYDVVVVGGGTAGSFAAATVAGEGLDVALLERKSEADAGKIACGDALKGGKKLPAVIDREYLTEEAVTNRHIRRIVYRNPEGENYEYPASQDGVMIDRERYGEVLLEEARRSGADIHYNTVVRDVRQQGRRVTGVEAVRAGDPVTYESDVVIDAAGAMSILQDCADFSGTTFDTNVDYTQFCSAYREVIETPEPLEYDDALVFTPVDEMGYLWYFPHSSRVVNAGLGFQMSEPSLPLVEYLRQDLQTRPEFEGATVLDKQGAALPTRRPYDSAVAPGFLAAGDAAGHVNPTTGGGIEGAAMAGYWAGSVAAEAVSDGTVSEAGLWRYNRSVHSTFGKRFAGLDCYNILGSAVDMTDIVEVIDAVPIQQVLAAVQEHDSLGDALSEDLMTEVVTAVTERGYWDVLQRAIETRQLAADLRELYGEFPDHPRAFAHWQRRRDNLMQEVYDVTGATPKY
jgi:electron-transferring-flavoprotein dehydrogenase